MGSKESSQTTVTGVFTHKHILNRQRRKWLGAFTWITETPLRKKKWTQNTINTLQSFLTPMTGLDNTETTMIALLLLLALVAHSSALPVSNRDRDDWMTAEVRHLSLAPDFDFFFSLSDTKVFHFTLLWDNNFVFCSKQKYLRRFYGLPAGLQGRDGPSSAFQSKIKEMQKFFKLKVRYGRTANYCLVSGFPL